VIYLRSTVLSLAAAIALTHAVVAPSTAAAQRDQLVVSTGWLAQHLEDRDVVLLHVGDGGEYIDKHIPGARYVSMRSISARDSAGSVRSLEMSQPDELRQQLQKLGISDGSRVIVYHSGGWISPATRVIFTLDYAGLGSRVSLLDGGLEAWEREGRPVTDAIPPRREGRLSALRIKPIVVDAAYVREHIGKSGFSIVDGRDAQFYDGVTPGAQKGRSRTGHIASAKSVPFSEVADERFLLRTPDELAALFEKAGVQQGDTIIGYCHIGQQATAMLFAARTLGHPILLYDGSFQEWASLEWPVETPSAPGKQ
jgi:thiosulfate/3-mercaptopyruvate sulfurtransferase